MTREGPACRPPLLAALLRRRAVAAAAGLADLEAMLRDQIREGLPVQSGSAIGDRPVGYGDGALHDPAPASSGRALVLTDLRRGLSLFRA